TALLTIGQTTPFVASVQSTGNGSTAVTWSSANTSLVTISANGTATAIARGLTSVVATSVADASKTGAAVVRVYDSTATSPNVWTLPIPSSAVSISRDVATQQLRDTVGITARATGASGTFQNPYTVVEFWARPFAGGA